MSEQINSQNYVTCRCQYCDKGIEFDASDFGAGETRTAECPHCRMETIIFVPPSKTPPPAPSPSQARAMKGIILDFAIQTNSGIISGDDNQRYSFHGAEWKASGVFPTHGTRVDFVIQSNTALAIYPIKNVTNTIGSASEHDKRPLEYQGFYRSSDEKTFAGVCGGLAHKWGVSRGAVQAIFVILFFFFFGWLIYPVCWLAFKTVPTKGVKFSD